MRVSIEANKTFATNTLIMRSQKRGLAGKNRWHAACNTESIMSPDLIINANPLRRLGIASFKALARTAVLTHDSGVRNPGCAP